MAISYNASLASLLPKQGFKIYEQVKTSWSAMKKGAVKEMVLKKKNNNIQIDDGHATATWTADFQNYRRSGRIPNEALYQTKLMTGGVEIGLQAHDETEGSGEGLQALRQALRKTVAGFTATWATAWYNFKIETLTATVTVGSASFETSDPTKYLPGLEYEVVRSSTVIDTFEVQDREVAGGGATSTITLRAVTAAEWQSGDIIQSYGAESYGPKGLVDVCGSGTLYGVAGTVNNWSGLEEDANADPFSKDTLEDLEDRRYTKCQGAEEAVVLLSKKTARKLFRFDKDLTGVRTDSTKPHLDDMEIIIDQFVGDADVFLHCPELVKWHTSLKLAPPGSSNKEFAPQELRKAEDSADYIYDLRQTGNIRPEMRSCEARYFDFT
jgi:hypothetical protein